MIRIISTPVFAIHRKKSYIHIDANPEDLLNKDKYEKEGYMTSHKGKFMEILRLINVGYCMLYIFLTILRC